MAQEITNPRLNFKTVILSALGGGLEFYDFIIFAIFAKNIGDAFFPAASPEATLLHSYLVFAIGYLARPLGGVIFSHFGDRYGRKKTFSFSISLMAIATLMMSILPAFKAWGLFATFLFIFLRLIQGLSIGGEIPGALVFVSEHFPKQKGAACAVILLFLNIGILLGDLIHITLASFLEGSFFNEFGWRIAFFLGGFFALISFIIRRSLKETASFLSNENKHKMPLLALLKCYKKNIFQVFSLAGAAASATSIFLLYFNSYAISILKLTAIESGALTFYQLIIFMLTSAIASFSTDRFGCLKILKISSLYLILMPLIVFYLINKGIYIEAVLLMNAVGIGCFSGAMPCYLSELFPVCVRYSGIALGYNLGFALFGGLSPLFSSILISAYQWNEAPGIIIAFSGLLAFLSLSFFSPTPVSIGVEVMPERRISN